MDWLWLPNVQETVLQLISHVCMEPGQKSGVVLVCTADICYSGGNLVTKANTFWRMRSVQLSPVCKEEASGFPGQLAGVE